MFLQPALCFPVCRQAGQRIRKRQRALWRGTVSMLWTCPPSRLMRARVSSSSQPLTVSSCGRLSARPGRLSWRWRGGEAESGGDWHGNGPPPAICTPAPAARFNKTGQGIKQAFVCRGWAGVQRRGGKTGARFFAGWTGKRVSVVSEKPRSDVSDTFLSVGHGNFSAKDKPFQPRCGF